MNRAGLGGTPTTRGPEMMNRWVLSDFVAILSGCATTTDLNSWKNCTTLAALDESAGLSVFPIRPACDAFLEETFVQSLAKQGVDSSRVTP
jgi:hypothetical protein